jgi:uncharacterized protein
MIFSCNSTDRRYMQNGVLFVVLGIIAGTLSGVIGIGGGVIIIPTLVFLFGFSQQQAQGTTLALLVPPIGILAAWTYYRAGFVDLRAAGLICIGFVGGSLLGAKIATSLTSQQLERIFGVVLLLISIKMIVGR